MTFEMPKKVKEVDPGHLNLLYDTHKLFTKAENYEFHDFKNGKYATPKIELRDQLLQMAKNVIDGRYDNLK